MNVKLPTDLINQNKAIRSSIMATMASPSSEGLSGKIFHGQSKVYANPIPGGVTSPVKYELEMPSVTEKAFDQFRNSVTVFMGTAVESEISLAARIENDVLPASRMSSYAINLLIRLFGFTKEELEHDGGVAFNCRNCQSKNGTDILEAMRELETATLHFSGTLEINPNGDASTRVEVIVPVTSVEFSDGLTIPFAGYTREVKMNSSGWEEYSHFQESEWT